ncbi:MAG: hypothetical protein ACI8XO_002174, partial [Verrucomicrobiales bacterium]
SAVTSISKSKPIVLGLHAWALLFDFEIEVTPSPAAMGFPDSLSSFGPIEGYKNSGAMWRS